MAPDPDIDPTDPLLRAPQGSQARRPAAPEHGRFSGARLPAGRGRQLGLGADGRVPQEARPRAAGARKPRRLRKVTSPAPCGRRARPASPSRAPPPRQGRVALVRPAGDDRGCRAAGPWQNSCTAPDTGMTRANIRHLVRKGRKAFWQPTPKMRALGFHAVLLGEMGPMPRDRRTLE
jgi:hypothetical protein